MFVGNDVAGYGEVARAEILPLEPSIVKPRIMLSARVVALTLA
jgi:hypothetical protein